MPYSKIRDLPRLVENLVDANDKENLLTWREESIPEAENVKF